MIYSSAQVAAPSGIFQGRVGEDIFQWKTNLPDLDTQQFFSLAGYDAVLNAVGKGGPETSFFEVAGRASVFQGLRNSMGYVAQSYGYFQSAVGAIQTFYASPLTDIARMAVGLVMDQVETAVNSISWVPVVGWIIKILYEIADLIFDVIRLVRKKQDQREQKALNELALSSRLPLAMPTAESDTKMGQALQQAILESNLEWMITPQYKATSAGDFHGLAQYGGNGDRPCTDGYLVSAARDALVGGLGYMPGSMNIHGAMELSTRGGAAIKDLGAFFPITQSIAATIWGQTLNGDSGLLFAVDTNRVAAYWSDYVRSAVEFAHDKMTGGWSLARDLLNTSRAENATKFKYTETCSALRRKKSKKGKWLALQGTGHTNAYLTYLHELFQWQGSSDPDKVNWDDIATTRALSKLRARQLASLDSITCMYLDDRDVAGGAPRYSAIRRGSSMHHQWQSNVRAVFEAGQWDRVDYRDVIPGGEVDMAIRDLLTPQGTDPATFFNMDSAVVSARGRKSLSYASAAGPSVLGDPVLPSPGETTDFEPVRRVGRISGPSKAAAGGAGVVLAGVAVAAFLALRKQVK